MKSLFSLLILFTTMIFFAACGEKEPKPLELYNPEAFAFPLENEWELNASVMVKGFAQEKTESGYKTGLVYYLNLVTPDSTFIKAADYGEVKNEIEEEITGGYQVESQITLDSAFAPGDYRIEFVVEDELKMEEAAIDTTFELLDLGGTK